MAPAMDSFPTVAEHNELIEEMQHVENLPVGDRIKLAQKRRKQQLSTYAKWLKTETGNSKQTKQKTRKSVSFSVLSQIMEVAARGSYEEMRTLLKTGIDPNMKNHDGLTALHLCCIEGTAETVALLLKYGANVNVSDRDMWTPLHAAATCGHFKVVTMLVKAGADVTAMNGDGDMPHDITEEEVTLHYIRNEMIKRNISPDELEQIRSRPHNQLLQDVEATLATNSDLNQPLGQDGATLLHVAIADGHNDIVRLLLDHGVSVTTQDGDGWQPVHVAAYWCNEEALDMLSSDPRVDLRAETTDGETPYELCDNANIKLNILHMLKVKQDSHYGCHDSESSDSLNTVEANHEDNMDSSPPPTITRDDNFGGETFNSVMDDALPSPLINIEAPEMHSDRKNSIKGVKINAPLKRQSSDRSSSKERQTIIMEGIRPMLIQRKESMENAAPTLPHHIDSYREFYEMVHPTAEITDPTTKMKTPQNSTADITPQSPYPVTQTHTQEHTETYTQTPDSTKDNLDSNHFPETPQNECSETTTVRETKSGGSPDIRTRDGMRELRDGLMLRPKKKAHAPPPPRGSLQDLKRQRQEEREHRLQRGLSDPGESLTSSTTYQSGTTPYEAPPSPSMMRYKYKMTTDEGIKQTLIREKKCIVM